MHNKHKKAEKKEEGGKIDLLLVLFFTSAEKQASILASGIQIRICSLLGLYYSWVLLNVYQGFHFYVPLPGLFVVEGENCILVPY